MIIDALLYMKKIAYIVVLKYFFANIIWYLIYCFSKKDKVIVRDIKMRMD